MWRRKCDNLLVCGSGGHTKRALVLADSLDRCCFIIPFESQWAKERVGKDYYSVVSPRFKAKSNKILTIIRTVFLFFHSFILLVYIRPRCVISTGSGLSLPVMLIARFLRVKTVYIESPSRVYVPSITGLFLMGKVNLWLSNWPELAERYSDVQYKGMLV